MSALKDAAMAYQKRDIFSLDKIPVDIEIKTDAFTKDGKVMDYMYIEINNWKYTIKAAYLEKLRQTLEMRPETKFVKAKKTADGEVYFVPVD